MRQAGRQSRQMAPPSRKRKSVNEEIAFDRTARQEYLTGFHKRKLQRIKVAQEESLKREKEEKIQDRKRLRDSRKEEIETHIKQVKALARKAAAQANGDPFDSGSGDDWAGIGEDSSEDDSEDEVVAEKLNKQEEYIDEDKFTTVKIEAMDFDAAEEIDSETERKNAAKREEAEKAEKERKKRKPKEKKKKFRYLTKTERKSDRVKLRTKMAKRREKFKDADSAKPKSSSKGKKK